MIMKYKYADPEEKMERSGCGILADMREIRNCKSLVEETSPFRDLLEENPRIPLREVWGTLQYTMNHGINGTNVQIIDADEATIRFYYGENQWDIVQITQETSFAGVLFAPDLISWEQIKDQNILHYMKDQLELITFDGEKA